MKKIAALFLIAAMVLSLAGCATKKAVSITFPELSSLEIVEIAKGCENVSVEGATIKVDVQKDGEYPMVIKADDGEEYSLVLKFEKGGATVINKNALVCIVGRK